MSDLNNDQGPASGAHPGNFEGESQSIGDGYGQMTNSQNDTGMGGGAGTHGSGVAGGYEGNQQQPAEKQDWLDKGLQFASKKVGYNLVRSSSVELYSLRHIEHFE